MASTYATSLAPLLPFPGQLGVHRLWGHHGLWRIGVELNFQVEMAEWEGEEAGEGDAWAGGDSCPLGFPGQQCPPTCQHCALQGPGGWSAPLSFEWMSARYRWRAVALAPSSWPAGTRMSHPCLGHPGHLMALGREELSSLPQADA